MWKEITTGLFHTGQGGKTGKACQVRGRKMGEEESAPVGGRGRTQRKEEEEGKGGGVETTAGERGVGMRGREGWRKESRKRWKKGRLEELIMKGKKQRHSERGK